MERRRELRPQAPKPPTLDEQVSPERAARLMGTETNEAKTSTKAPLSLGEKALALGMTATLATAAGTEGYKQAMSEDETPKSTTMEPHKEVRTSNAALTLDRKIEIVHNADQPLQQLTTTIEVTPFNAGDPFTKDDSLTAETYTLVGYMNQSGEVINSQDYPMQITDSAGAIVTSERISTLLKGVGLVNEPEAQALQLADSARLSSEAKINRITDEIEEAHMQPRTEG